MQGDKLKWFKFIDEYMNEAFLNLLKLDKRYSETNTHLTSALDMFGETLVAVIYDGILPGGKGLGYDVVSKDRSSALEVKTASWIHPNECLNCGFRVPFYAEFCVNCGEKFVYKKQDSRFGINAKKFFTEKESDKYVLVFLNLEYDSKVELGKKITVEVFEVLKDNEYFIDYAKGQLENGNANTLNLVPYGYDFMMLEPKKLIKWSANIDWDEIKLLDIKHEVIMKKITDMPSSLFSKSVREALQLSEDVEVSISKVKDRGIWLKNKSHRKPRGTVKKSKILRKSN